MSPLFKTLLGHLGVAVVGGGIGGIAVWSAVSSKGPEAKISRELSAARGDASMGTRPERSGSEERAPMGTKRLEERLATLERQSSAQKAVAHYLETMDRDAGAGDPALQALVAANNPALETAVRGVMERVETERREQRENEAQNRQMERASNAAGLLEQKLKLDANQKAQVEVAFVTAMEAFQKLRGGQEGSPPASREDWRKATTEIRQRLDKEIGGVLSEDQKKAYSELKQKDDEVREVSRMFGGGRGGGGPPR